MKPPFNPALKSPPTADEILLESAKKVRGAEVPKAAPLPTCPYCDARPCPLAVSITSFDAATHAAVFCCVVCGKIISVAPLIPSQQRATNGPNRPIIHIPGVTD